jgi:hypothetical protein
MLKLISILSTATMVEIVPDKAEDVAQPDMKRHASSKQAVANFGRFAACRFDVIIDRFVQQILNFVEGPSLYGDVVIETDCFPLAWPAARETC